MCSPIKFTLLTVEVIMRVDNAAVLISRNIRNQYYRFTGIAFGAIIYLAMATIPICAQQNTVSITPGRPAGSYQLDEFATINPFNGGLNFSLPLSTVSG